jgi:hypothetical protein
MTDTPSTNPALPNVSIDDLLKLIGDRDVTIHRQGLLIAQQARQLQALSPQQGNGQVQDMPPVDTSTSPTIALQGEA